MKVECQVQECWEYHDMENESINDRAYKLAKIIESTLGNRQIFCQCNIEKYVVSIKAQRALKADCKTIIGCPHFNEQLVKATDYVKNNLMIYLPNG